MTVTRWLAAVTLVAACGDGDFAGTHVTVVDSAGVEIVTSTAPGWDESSAWRVADTPSLQIGVLDGDERLQFQRVTDIALLSNGLVIANGGSSEVRVFSMTGDPIASAGRRGQGPGEFAYLSSVRVEGDTIVAHDGILHRLTFIDETGTVMGDAPMPSTVFGRVSVIGRFGDGSYAVMANGLGSVGKVTGLQRASALIGKMNAARTSIDTLGVFPGDETYTTEFQGNRITGPGNFARSLSHAVSGDLLFLGTQDVPEMRVYDATGALKRIVRMPSRDLAVSTADVTAIRAALQERASEAPDPTTYVDQMLEMWPVPEQKPAYSRFLTDPHGNLWVAVTANSALGEEPTAWTVFDPEGRMLGDVLAPSRFRIFEIGPDALFGVWRDDDDVEYIRSYQIIRH